jgi:hypothetical protein
MAGLQMARREARRAIFCGLFLSSFFAQSRAGRKVRRRAL